MIHIYCFIFCASVNSTSANLKNYMQSASESYFEIINGKL